jgi:hypothetical protein
MRWQFGQRSGTRRRDRNSDNERPSRLLEGGDRAVGLGKCSLEVSENLSDGRPGRCGRQIGRRPATQQRRADRTLTPLKSTPDPPECSIAPRTVGLADRGGDAVGDSPFQELPERACGQAQPADFLDEPDADGPSAAESAMAVAAENPPGPDRSPGRTVIESGEYAVPDERADGPAMRAGRELEPLDNRRPLCLTPVKPSLRAHSRIQSRKVSERTSGQKRRRRARSDNFGRMGKTESPNRNRPQNRTRRVYQIPGV